MWGLLPREFSGGVPGALRALGWGSDPGGIFQGLRSAWAQWGISLDSSCLWLSQGWYLMIFFFIQPSLKVSELCPAHPPAALVAASQAADSSGLQRNGTKTHLVRASPCHSGCALQRRQIRAFCVCGWGTSRVMLGLRGAWLVPALQ